MNPIANALALSSMLLSPVAYVTSNCPNGQCNVRTTPTAPRYAPVRRTLQAVARPRIIVQEPPQSVYAPSQPTYSSVVTGRYAIVEDGTSIPLEPGETYVRGSLRDVTYAQPTAKPTAKSVEAEVTNLYGIDEDGTKRELAILRLRVEELERRMNECEGGRCQCPFGVPTK